MEIAEQIEKLFDAKLDTVHVKLDSIFDQTKRTNGRVSKLEEWKEKREPMLSDISANRKETKGRLRDIFWELIRIVVIAVFSGFATIIGMEKLLK